MIAAGQGGRGAEGHRGRSAFYDAQLSRALERLLAIAGLQARSRSSVIEGRHIHFLEAGTGPPLLLLHGASGGGGNWYRVMARLAATHRVLAPDLPGYGASDPVEPRAPLGQSVAAALVPWLQTQIAGSFSVVGTSFGALVAARLAQKLELRRLVLLDAVGLGHDVALPMRLACLPILSALAVRPSRLGTRWLVRHLVTTRRLPRADEDALVDYLYYSARAGDPATMARAFALFAGWQGQREVITAAELQALQLPILLIWGERDRFVPYTHAQQAATLAPNACVSIIPHVGHSPNWEAADDVARLISDFLST